LAVVAEDAAVCFRKIVVGQTFVSVPGFDLSTGKNACPTCSIDAIFLTGKNLRLPYFSLGGFMVLYHDTKWRPFKPLRA
jgi:hypothetical protein